MFFKNRISNRGNNQINIAQKIKAKQSKIKLIGENELTIAENFVCVNSVNVRIDGCGNKVHIGKNFRLNGDLLLNIVGDNNTVFIGNDFNKVNFQSSQLEIRVNGKNNTVTMAPEVEVITELFMDLNDPADNRTVDVGSKTSFYKTNIKCSDINSAIKIGEDCMFSYDTAIYNTDGHSVFQDGKLTNKAETCQIGDHVWVGWSATILKNCKIPSGTIIGRGALVCKSFEQENVAIGGNPAKIIKENISWSRETPTQSLEMEKNK